MSTPEQPQLPEQPQFPEQVPPLEQPQPFQESKPQYAAPAQQYEQPQPFKQPQQQYEQQPQQQYEQPHHSGQFFTANQPKPGRGLSLTAMALGLVALLTAAVSAFYFSIFLYAAAALGIAAIVCAIIALVKRQRPLAPSIVGGASGLLSLIVAAIVGAIVIFMMVTGGVFGNSTMGYGSGSGAAPVVPEDGTSDSDADASSPHGDVPSMSVEWPSNMASGGILFTADGDAVSVYPSDALPDNSFPDPQFSLTASDDLIQLYVDYRCPYCAVFEEANADVLERAITKGGANLELHALTFLDRASAGSYYSSRAAGSMACIADGQPGAAWPAHQALLSTSFQPSEGIDGHDNAAIIAALDEATGGLNPVARSCIESEQFVPISQALNTWVFDTTVPGAENPDLTVTGTPFAVVNGVPYAGAVDDAQAFEAFLTERGISLG